MAPQDSFIDEDDDSCPLCVEEFDLSDKNFRPCPCGYQVCQFCFNNIKNNMNGLCPACRRPYDEKTIEWKVVTQEDPAIREEEILQTLRGDKYFGQYGKIIKIVVSKSKQGDAAQNAQGLGVYVTFARKEDAARCIAAVNGSQNGDRILRAQLGTTKYCSAYLRNEVCTNKQCMFLHEPGDNDDSYSRQDLSSINSVNTQRPLPAMASSSASSSRQNAAQAPLQQAQPVAAAAQSMIRESSKDGSDSGDGSALPSSASWANRGIQQRSRRGSHATSGATSSPAVSQAMPATAEVVEDSPPPSQEPQSEIVEPVVAEDPAPTVESPRPSRDPILMDLLKSINSPEFSLAPTTSTEETSPSSTFPPLFDDHGGEKRRARKHQEEEARLQMEQESQADMRSIAEQAEEEEPESGSLQLGGEPEDRDSGRELPQGFQRRPSTQLPIQRTNNGPVGPSIGNFPRNLSNLSSINGRTLTPQQQQQLLLLNSSQSQSTFMDQFSPGISGQLGQGSGLFQQQGHNRQSSRYTFGNDSSSTSSIKPSANPKLMAQQSSMMPSASHAQAGNQFYGSSIQGPPPGLKSSGTPPIGGMFGQSNAFGGSVSGSTGFGSAKESSNEMLRDMIRARGGNVGGQSHDTGKREFMFPSFLQQYPSASSTPAPASGLLASLYGPQTGAFHDFGQKQKKKGKKHRHANTSSSGGGGLVDLADPSILQARMQHQQQSNAGVGQGLFGSQAQDDEGLPFDEATLSVDALVADSTADDFGAPLPSSFIIEPVSRKATPEKSVSQAKQDIKSLATNTSLSKTIASQSSQPLQSGDFPPLETGKTKTPSGPALNKTQSSIKPSASNSTKKPAANTASSVATTRPSTKAEKRPGILNISVPSKPNKTLSSTETANKPAVDASSSSEYPPLRPTSTPSTASVQSPLSRSAPKILRIPTTTKIETATGGNATPSSATSTFAQMLPASRQPSLVSVSRQERPGTPTSDVISDNASVTSTSFSRASSPPPSRIGSAPVRTTTKSMQKKLRKEAQKTKEKTEMEVVTPKVESEEIAPIMGRKKKQKKERNIHSAAGGSTPAASRPPSPGPADSSKEEASTRLGLITETSAQAPQLAEEQQTAEVNKASAKGPEPKGKGKTKVPPSPVSEAVAVENEEEPAAADKPLPTPASTYHELLSAGVVPDPNNLALLKNPSSASRLSNIELETQAAHQKLTITPEDRAALQAGCAVHKNEGTPHRIMLTANGDYVRNLSPEEEQRYLQLQASIAKEFGPAAFVSTKHHVNNGFTLIGGRAVPNGPPSFFPPGNGSASSLDAVSKIQRDEALSYINQYVLPSLSTNSQLEKALNANALDAEMLRSTDPSSFPNWGNDPTATIDGSVKAPTQEGILGTSLEGMTAHFAVGRDGDSGRPLGNVSLLSLPEAESGMQLARKEAESLEKKLHALMKKNRRLLLGSAH
ncbi:hypothetical protein G7Y89_g2794 [Cudoniella acicularis]|uniref:RING-type domain-containing protein n=1 Tax=Cudoniella acicularis TaxID=354080 RepID=A0A8H4W6M1_9HELO|nr:hypothetical protein G7Y89_g2794 [Cudoniella acicularis]